MEIKLGNNKIVSGENSLEFLSELDPVGKKFLIVMSGNSLKDVGMYKHLEEVLNINNYEYIDFSEVEPEPTVNSIYKGVEVARQFEPDWIVGFGGGSAMDAAKAIWVFYENQEAKELSEIAAPNDFKKLRDKARLVCIPTTAGTGSESTRASLIKDPVQQKKYSIRCMKGRLIPDVAILDPRFTATMPKSLISTSGMDAITHAIETYVCNVANPFSDVLSSGTFKLLYENVYEAYSVNELNSRQNMLVGSCLAGISFSNGALGVVHSLAHSFGATFNIPHGLANAVILPYGIEFNSSDVRTKERYSFLARTVGAENLLDSIIQLKEKMNIPIKMSELVTEEQFSENFESLIEKVLTDVCTPTNPITITREDAKNLLIKVYNG